MSRNIFSPRTSVLSSDSIADYLLLMGRFLFGVGVFLVPLFYVTNLFNPVGQQKNFMFAVCVGVALLFASLAHLRLGVVRIHLVFPWLILGLLLLIMLVSALLSGDVKGSVWGLVFDSNSVAFMVLLSVTMLMGQIFVGSLRSISNVVLILLLSSSIVLGLTVLGLFVPGLPGQSTLSSGLSLFGGLNDLAIMAGAVVVGIVATIQASTRSLTTKIFALLLMLLSTLILVVVNFSLLWYFILFFCLLSLLYLLSRDTWLSPEAVAEVPVSRLALMVVGFMCVVSGAFVMSGDYLGGQVSKLTGLSYLEVRPSFKATFDIAKSVYQYDALLGIGPNRFDDAWRLHKNPVIAETSFWNTSFISGNSFVSTFFVTSGLLGGLLLLVFIAFYHLVGYRLLMATRQSGSSIYFIASGLFAVSCFGWLVTFFYSPGSGVLILLAVVSGLVMALYASLMNQALYIIDVRQIRQHGLILIASILVVIVGAGSFIYQVGKQFTAQHIYAKAQTTFGVDGNLLEYDSALIRAQDLFMSDFYIAERARLRLLELNRLMNITEPTADDGQLFESIFREGISLLDQALSLDASNPYYHAMRGSFLGLLSESVFEGVTELRVEAFARARELDPYNPEYLTLEARFLARVGDVDGARQLLRDAIRIKSNYVEALSYQAQIEIETGNTEAAIATTRSIVNINFNNPALHFQLGLLLSAVGDILGATEAFSMAVRLDRNFANARYLLAIALLDQGKIEEAILELKVVAETNQDNTELLNLIALLESGDYTTPNIDQGALRTGPVINDAGEVVVSSSNPESDLLVPVNRLPTSDATEESLPVTTNVDGTESEG
jgi:tetratricopeptide (TPR) repeat protein